MKKSFLSVILISTISLLFFIQCEEDTTPDPPETITLTINLSGLTFSETSLEGKSGTVKKTKETSSWNHIFDNNLSIEFANQETETSYYLNYNPAATNNQYTITLPYGTYRYSLTSEGDEYSSYLPFEAAGTLQINTTNITLNLIAETLYGLITVSQDYVTEVHLEDSELETINLYNAQGKFYSYVAENRLTQIVVTDDSLNSFPTFDVPTVQSQIHYAFTLDESKQRTYVPDDVFEQRLIDLGYDDVLDNYVLTSNISDLVSLDITTNIEDWQNNNEDKFIHDLTGIEDFVMLEGLDASLNKISIINLELNKELKYLHLTYNELNSLNLSANVNLVQLMLDYNHINSLDLSNNIALKNLYVNNNLLTSLNLENNTNLEILRLQRNEIENISLGNSSNLMLLDISYNNLTEIDLENFTSLRYLALVYNSLTSLDLSNNTLLESIILSNNPLEYVDIGTISLLNDITIENTLISSLDVSNNVELNYLFVRDNLNLSCIMVNESQFLTQNPISWRKDDQASYSLYCCANSNNSLLVGEWTVVMYDSYGDGWQTTNGDAGDPFQIFLGNGEIIEFGMCSRWASNSDFDCTETDGYSSTYILSIPENSQGGLWYFPGDYWGEIAFDIFDPSGTLVYSSSTGSILNGTFLPIGTCSQ